MYSLVFWKDTKISEILKTEYTKTHKKFGFMAKRGKKYEQADLVKTARE